MSRSTALVRTRTRKIKAAKLIKQSQHPMEVTVDAAASPSGMDGRWGAKGTVGHTGALSFMGVPQAQFSGTLGGDDGLQPPAVNGVVSFSSNPPLIRPPGRGGPRTHLRAL